MHSDAHSLPPYPPNANCVLQLYFFSLRGRRQMLVVFLKPEVAATLR